jgi:hypothetical protein
MSNKSFYELIFSEGNIVCKLGKIGDGMTSLSLEVLCI